MKRLLSLLLALVAGHTLAAEQLIAKLIDPAEDDVGDGSLSYPAKGDFPPRSFDLRSLEISRDRDGFWFVATFGDFIREMWWAPDGGVRSRNHRLRFGFNLDLYIDIDRKPGSGQMFTLPGRKARIDRRYAWERAVILSPQPLTARGQLLAKLKSNFPNRPPGEAEAAIDKTMYFPVKRSVFDKSVRFFVPKEFIGDSDGEDWALTAFVTKAAPIEDDDNLGVRQPGKEARPDAFTYSGREEAPSPVIDVLLPSAELQYRLLASARPLVGSSWGARAVDEFEIEESSETLASRLRELKEMVDHGLIGDAEYKAQRQRVLADL
jgi:hypothetical protein